LLLCGISGDVDDVYDDVQGASPPPLPTGNRPPLKNHKSVPCWYILIVLPGCSVLVL